MKNLVKTSITLFLSVYLLYTSVNINTFPLYENQITPCGYDETIPKDISGY